MWKLLGEKILQFRYLFLLLILAITVFMGWHASQVKINYEFSNAIPTDNPKFLAYQEFKKKFGEEGGLLVIGFKTDQLFDSATFNNYVQLHKRIKTLEGIKNILSVPTSINLVRVEETEKLAAVPIFRDVVLTQQELDSSRDVFLNLPFYKGLLYNQETKAWLTAINVETAVFNSPRRSAVVNNLIQITDSFSSENNIDVHLSGLPLIRTLVADKIQREMRYFLLGSLVLSALILLIFFRSLSSTLLSLGVVMIGVVWSFGVLDLFGYKITLLTALIPPLIVVIGIPNCIYFLNKYHQSFRELGEKKTSIINMVSKMGIVTLFCNIAAAIGFAVFGLTKSAILREFGNVAGISIMLLFVISLVVIPIVLNFLSPPKKRHTLYLDNKLLHKWLFRLERWSINHRKLIFTATAIIIIASVGGIFQLKSKAHIIDDLPKDDEIYTSLKFFEENFEGVMPLEIAVDTRKKYGITRNLKNLAKVDSLNEFLSSKPYIGRPLSITEGLKFAKQAFFEGDSSYYIMPGENDMIALRPYLGGTSDNSGSGDAFSKSLLSFIDSNKQETRISVSMKDVGTEELPLILDTIESYATTLFDTSQYTLKFTGTSVTFLEGSKFIINGLKESIFWAFFLIALSMLYLFRSLRILLCSLIPNVIPLVITAGIMGWAGIPLKPSTVLIFSVALGIAIDITIRFLVNFKQDLKQENYNVQTTVIKTIHSTGISIIYTSIVLTVGFIIFCFSGFGGTQALGWLTSITLFTATVANLVLLPALLIVFYKNKKVADKI